MGKDYPKKLNTNIQDYLPISKVSKIEKKYPKKLGKIEIKSPLGLKSPFDIINESRRYIREAPQVGMGDVKTAETQGPAESTAGRDIQVENIPNPLVKEYITPNVPEFLNQFIESITSVKNAPPKEAVRTAPEVSLHKRKVETLEKVRSGEVRIPEIIKVQGDDAILQYLGLEESGPLNLLTEKAIEIPFALQNLSTVLPINIAKLINPKVDESKLLPEVDKRAGYKKYTPYEMPSYTTGSEAEDFLFKTGPDIAAIILTQGAVAPGISKVLSNPRTASILSSGLGFTLPGQPRQLSELTAGKITPEQYAEETGTSFVTGGLFGANPFKGFLKRTLYNSFVTTLPGQYASLIKTGKFDIKEYIKSAVTQGLLDAVMHIPGLRKQNKRQFVKENIIEDLTNEVEKIPENERTVENVITRLDRLLEKAVPGITAKNRLLEMGKPHKWEITEEGDIIEVKKKEAEPMILAKGKFWNDILREDKPFGYEEVKSKQAEGKKEMGIVPIETKPEVKKYEQTEAQKILMREKAAERNAKLREEMKTKVIPMLRDWVQREDTYEKFRSRIQRELLNNSDRVGKALVDYGYVSEYATSLNVYKPFQDFYNTFKKAPEQRKPIEEYLAEIPEPTAEEIKRAQEFVKIKREANLNLNSVVAGWKMGSGQIRKGLNDIEKGSIHTQEAKLVLDKINEAYKDGIKINIDRRNAVGQEFMNAEALQIITEERLGKKPKQTADEFKQTLVNIATTDEGVSAEGIKKARELANESKDLFTTEQIKDINWFIKNLQDKLINREPEKSAVLTFDKLAGIYNKFMDSKAEFSYGEYKIGQSNNYKSEIGAIKKLTEILERTVSNNKMPEDIQREFKQLKRGEPEKPAVLTAEQIREKQAELDRIKERSGKTIAELYPEKGENVKTFESQEEFENAKREYAMKYYINDNSVVEDSYRQDLKRQGFDRIEIKEGKKEEIKATESTEGELFAEGKTGQEEKEGILEKKKYKGYNIVKQKGRFGTIHYSVLEFLKGDYQKTDNKLPDGTMNVADSYEELMKKIDKFEKPTGPEKEIEGTYQNKLTKTKFDIIKDEGSRILIKKSNTNENSYYIKRESLESNYVKSEPEEAPEVKQNREKQKEQAERMRKIADSMENTIQSKLHPASALQNPTYRRSNMAGRQIEQGEMLQKVQAKLRALADAHDNRTVPEILKEITSKTEVEYLLENKRIPNIWLNRSTIKSLFEIIEGKRGAIELRRKINSLSEEANLTNTQITALSEAITEISKFSSDYTVEGIKNRLKDYNRIKKLGIETQEQYDKAREELENLGGRLELTPEEIKRKEIKKLEDSLIGNQIPGYFDTRGEGLERVIEAADIKPGMDVLEPSAGKGNIADKIREQGAEPDVIELNYTLRDILQKKGYELKGDDFLEYTGKQYDRIVMNPPFENMQDIEHVRHAYDLLKPGGKIVAVMSESGFFRGDKKAVEFREWFEEVNGTSEKMPEGSFKGIGGTRSTEVNARLVIIDKPEMTHREAEEEKKIGETIEKGYRVESGYRHDRNAKAIDVIKFEEEELGNKYNIPEKVLNELKTRNADDLIWVTKTAEDARRYGKEIGEVDLPEGSKIIAVDGDGGYLVLKGSEPELPEGSRVGTSRIAPIESKEAMENYYKFDETGRILLKFNKQVYDNLTVEQKGTIRSNYLWSKSRGAWISRGSRHTYRAEQVAKELGLTFKGKEERLTFAEEQELKQEKAEGRIERYQKRIENSKEKQESLQKMFNSLRGDIAFLTQPIIRGHSGSERFGRQRDRIYRSYEKGFEEIDKQKYYRNRIESAMETAAAEKLEDAGYIDRKIKETTKDINKIEKWTAEYEEKLKNTELAEEDRAKYLKWYEEGIDKLNYQMGKLLYYQEALNKLEESGVKIWKPEELKDAEYVKFRKDWYKVIRVNPTTITHSWFVGTFKHGIAEIQEVLFKGDKAKILDSHIQGSYKITDIERGIPEIVKTFGEKIDEKYEEARQRIQERKEKYGLRAQILPNPENIPDYIIIGAKHFKDLYNASADKVVKFVEWSNKMIEEAGEYVKPYLRQIWQEVKKQEDIIKEEGRSEKQEVREEKPEDFRFTEKGEIQKEKIELTADDIRELEYRALEYKKDGRTNQYVRDKLGYDFNYEKDPAGEVKSAVFIGEVTPKENYGKGDIPELERQALELKRKHKSNKQIRRLLGHDFTYSRNDITGEFTKAKYWGEVKRSETSKVKSEKEIYSEELEGIPLKERNNYAELEEQYYDLLKYRKMLNKGNAEYDNITQSLKNIHEKMTEIEAGMNEKYYEYDPEGAVAKRRAGEKRDLISTALEMIPKFEQKAAEKGYTGEDAKEQVKRELTKELYTNKDFQQLSTRKKAKILKQLDKFYEERSKQEFKLINTLDEQYTEPKLRNFFKKSVLQSIKVVEKMGEGGKEIANRLKRMEDHERQLMGEPSKIMLEAENLTDAELKNLHDIRTSLMFFEEPMNPISKNVARVNSMLDNYYYKMAEGFKERGFITTNPATGEKYLFNPLKRYEPRILDLQLDKLGITRDKQGRAIHDSRRETILQYLVDTNQADNKAEAEAKLQGYIAMQNTRIGRQGNVEFARVLEFPRAMYVKDPITRLIKYATRSAKRLAHADAFGIEGNIASRLLDRVRGEYYDQQFARDLYRYETGQLTVSERKALESINVLKGIQAVTKFSPFTTLRNAMQGFLGSSSRGNIKAGLTGLIKGYTKEARKNAYLSGALADTLENYVGREMGGESKFVSNYLKWIGFTGTDKFNRIISSAAGEVFYKDMLERIKTDSILKKRAEREFNKMGLDAGKIKERGHFTEEELNKIRRTFAGDAQFNIRPSDLPLYWSSPVGKMVTQWKSFGYKMTQLINDNIIKELKAGNVFPLMTMLGAYTITGEAVNTIIDAVRSVFNFNPRKEDIDSEGFIDKLAYTKLKKGKLGEFALRIVYDLSGLGAMSIAVDIFRSMGYGKSSAMDTSLGVTGAVFGPTISTGIGITADILGPFAYKIFSTEGDWDETFKRSMRGVYRTAAANIPFGSIPRTLGMTKLMENKIFGIEPSKKVQQYMEMKKRGVNITKLIEIDNMESEVQKLRKKALETGEPADAEAYRQADEELDLLKESSEEYQEYRKLVKEEQGKNDEILGKKKKYKVY